jgi:hypothetical protein
MQLNTEDKCILSRIIHKIKRNPNNGLNILDY